MIADTECKSWQQKANDWLCKAPAYPPDTYRGRGIVISAGGPKYFICAWVCVKILQALGCKLPIEFWYLGRSEMDERMKELADELGVTCVDGLQRAERIQGFSWGERPGWQLKALSLIAGSFEEVLLIDGDNVPIVDPTFLFDHSEYRRTGAVFWPDYTRFAPDRDIWRICGVTYRDEPEFESGQIVVHKKRCWHELWLALFYNIHNRFYYKHMWGDKDTFHMAWRRLATVYSMPPFPIRNLANKVMCQHDFNGRIIFQHRNRAKWVLPANQNMRIAGFKLEDRCIGFLQLLESKWLGTVKAPRPKSKREIEAYTELVSIGVFVYTRVGYDKRHLEFLANQEIGRGRAECEQLWYVEERDNTVRLVVEGNGMSTLHARRAENGIWMGSWQIHERMPVELIPARQFQTQMLTLEGASRWEELLRQRYIYIRVNHDKRLIELCKDGTVGMGAGPCERRWELVEAKNQRPYLLVHGDKGITCQLTENDDGVWRGKWLIGERMAINLVPIPEEAPA